MTVILFILKIIGILLLSLIGIVFFLLALLLFVPVRYQISGEIDDKVGLLGKVHWLLHIVSIAFSYDGEAFDYAIRIFGFRLRLGKKKKQALDDEDFEDDMPDIDTSVKQDNSADEMMQPDLDGEETLDETAKKVEVIPAQEQKVKKKRTSIWQKIRPFFEKIKNSIEQFHRVLKQFPEKIKDIKTFLTDETNKKSVSLILAELKYLLRHSRFRKIKTKLHFSMADPATTGQVLGILCMIPILYRYEINIYPDFETEKIYVKGNYFFKGHIRLIHILVSIVRLWKEKEFRKFVNHISKK